MASLTAPGPLVGAPNSVAQIFFAPSPFAVMSDRSEVGVWAMIDHPEHVLYEIPTYRSYGWFEIASK